MRPNFSVVVETRTIAFRLRHNRNDSARMCVCACAFAANRMGIQRVTHRPSGIDRDGGNVYMNIFLFKKISSSNANSYRQPPPIPPPRLTLSHCFISVSVPFSLLLLLLLMLQYTIFERLRCIRSEVTFTPSTLNRVYAKKCHRHTHTHAQICRICIYRCIYLPRNNMA